MPLRLTASLVKGEINFSLLYKFVTGLGTLHNYFYVTISEGQKFWQGLAQFPFLESQLAMLGMRLHIS